MLGFSAEGLSSGEEEGRPPGSLLFGGGDEEAMAEKTL